MALARESFPAVNLDFLKPARWSRLGIGAAVLCFIFGVTAFLALIVRDRGHANVMVHDQAAPTPSASKAAVLPNAGGHAADARGAANVFRPQGPAVAARAKTGFNLARIDRPVALGSIKLKLLKTDMARGLFDVNVIIGGRSYTHRRLKVTQPLWIAINRGSKSIQIMVDTIGKDSIAGYWTESSRSAQVSSRSRSRRH